MSDKKKDRSEDAPREIPQIGPNDPDTTTAEERAEIGRRLAADAVRTRAPIR